MAMIGDSITQGLSMVGGLLGDSVSDSDAKLIYTDATPSADRSLQAAIYAGLLGTGFGDIGALRNTGPIDQLIARINALPIENKVKRRALRGIQEVSSGLSPTKTPGAGAGSTVRRRGELDAVLKRIGLSHQDLIDTVGRQREWRERFGALEQDMGPFQEQVIRDRLSATSNLNAGIAGIASGQGSPLQNSFREQFLRDRERGIADARETAMLRAQYGGFNPSASLENLDRLDADRFLDAELSSLERAMGTIGGLTQMLNGTYAGTANAAGLSQNASLGALGIANQQANASNDYQRQIMAQSPDTINAVFQGLAGISDTWSQGTGLASSLFSGMGQSALGGGAGGSTGESAPASDTGGANAGGGLGIGALASLAGLFA